MANELLKRQCGAVRISGGVRFGVWAPKAHRVGLWLSHLSQPIAMQREDRGLFSVTVAGIEEGARYAYILNDGTPRADPCSLWQPEGAEGSSAVFFPERFSWTDKTWRGVRREALVFYEIHVGTFTTEGTFEAIIPRLEALKELGISAIELMPVGQFSGDRNWGYDGVLPYAAQHSYGGPRQLQKLVDAAHAAGLAIFLDVVYNHFGPEHSYLDEFGHYFNDRHKTPWGRAVNFDGEHSDPVRGYILDNVRMWLDEFHFDGLRLDAVHTIYDWGAPHILRDIAQVAEDVSRCTGRLIHIVAESALHEPEIVRSAALGGHGLDAQWRDDFHHAVHAYLTGEKRGYYHAYGERRQIVEVLSDSVVCVGESRKSVGQNCDLKSGVISGDHFVVCVQNHDQVGNRAKGERLSALLGDPAKMRLAACLLLFAPHLPLLFMGEEYGEENPFPFFCSFRGEDLIRAVREGRKREFADFVDDGEEIPVPDARETFESARLTWRWPEGSAQACMRALYRDLLRVRREWPALQDFTPRGSRLLPDEVSGSTLELLRGRHSQAVRLHFNLTNERQALHCNDRPVFSSEMRAYGGQRRSFADIGNLEAFECVAFGGGEDLRPQ